MSRGFTVTDIIDEIRSLTDESNEVQLDTSSDILPSLNRAQEKAYQILSRNYPEPILTYTEIEGLSSRERALPENVWEDKIKRLEWYKGNEAPRVCEEQPLHVFSKFSSEIASPYPICYKMFGRTMRFCNPPDGTKNLRIWHLREIDALVKPIGRIFSVDTSSNTVYLSDVDEDFDVTSSDLTEYVNIVDGQTGQIKASCQIRSWDEVETMQFKSSSDRSSVLNRTISTDLTEISVSEDDYICPIRGTCVLFFSDAVHSFIVQYTVAEMKRKMGYSYDVDQNLIKDFEVDLRKTYAGRDQKMQIKRSNPNWMRSTRRIFSRRGGLY